MVLLRPAEPKDAPAAARLHIASWQSAYKGILPDAYLYDEIHRERPAAWHRLLAGEEGEALVILAEDGAEPGRNGELVGLIAIRLGMNDGFDAYLDNLHVHPDYRGGGLGRRLIAAAVEALIARGQKSIYLWVFDQNPAARRLYERLGGQIGEGGFDDFAGAAAAHTRIFWPDMAVLLDACQQN